LILGRHRVAGDRTDVDAVPVGGKHPGIEDRTRLLGRHVHRVVGCDVLDGIDARNGVCCREGRRTAHVITDRVVRPAQLARVAYDGPADYVARAIQDLAEQGPVSRSDAPRRQLPRGIHREPAGIGEISLKGHKGAVEGCILILDKPQLHRGAGGDAQGEGAVRQAVR